MDRLLAASNDVSWNWKIIFYLTRWFYITGMLEGEPNTSHRVVLRLFLLVVYIFWFVYFILECKYFPYLLWSDLKSLPAKVKFWELRKCLTTEVYPPLCRTSSCLAVSVPPNSKVRGCCKAFKNIEHYNRILLEAFFSFLYHWVKHIQSFYDNIFNPFHTTMEENDGSFCYSHAFGQWDWWHAIWHFWGTVV